MRKEVWKDIEGFGGKYQVSNFGRVRSLNYRRSGKIKVRKLYEDDVYVHVDLWNKGKGTTYGVHRLVAKAFVPNPNNYPIVNHKDENKHNNIYTNLEWCDQEYNVNYGNGMNKKREKQLNRKDQSKVVMQYTLDGELVNIFHSLMECGRNGFNTGAVGECCRGNKKSYKGFIWKYA